MYTLAGYGEMISDRIRIQAYAQALRNVIHPGAVVMDIGTGPGIMAVLACQFGAGRVYAIEPGAIIQLAREIAAANQCADRIEFFEGVSTKAAIPVQADVIVSDLRGVLPLFGQHVPSIADARRRFLTPGGTLIARSDSMFVAVVEAPEHYGNIVNPWDLNTLGQDLTPARRRVLNDIQKVRLAPEGLLTEPKLWAKLDYTSIENPDVQGSVHWTAKRDGTGHGFLVWFDADLAEGVGFSNSPEAPDTAYAAAFFPWLEPAPLVAGQSVSVDLEAKLADGDYLWRWVTQIASREKPDEPAMRFEQSQLRAEMRSPAKLRKTETEFVPELSADGLIRLRTLELMDGNSSLEAIARQLSAQFPQRFNDWRKALVYAGKISSESSC